MFSICTFNIAHGRGLATSNWKGGSLRQRRIRNRKIARVIKDYDVVVLQEVDVATPWSWYQINQYEYFKYHCGFTHGLVLTTNPIAQAGLAILSKFPLYSPHVIRLPQYSKAQRLLRYRKDALACSVVTDRGDFQLVAVHLDHRGRDVTIPSANHLIDYCRCQELATVLAGDFNSTPLAFPNSRDTQPTALDIIRQSGIFQVHPARDPGLEHMTHPTSNPRCIIDWVLPPQHWSVTDYRVINVKLSDHKPVVATIEKSSLL